MSFSQTKLDIMPARIELGKYKTKGFNLRYKGMLLTVAYKTKLPGIPTMDDLDRIPKLYIAGNKLMTIPSALVLSERHIRVSNVPYQAIPYNVEHAPRRIVNVLEEIFAHVVAKNPVVPKIIVSKNSKLGIIIKDSNKREYLSLPNRQSLVSGTARNQVYRYMSEHSHVVANVPDIIEGTGLLLEHGLAAENENAEILREALSISNPNSGFVYAKQGLIPIE